MTADFGWIARAYLTLLLFGLPYLAVRGTPSEGEVARLVGSRRALYVSTAVSLVFLALVTWGVASWDGPPGRELGWRAGPLREVSLWTVGVTGAGLAAVWAVSRAGRALGARESSVLHLLIPRTTAGRGGFVVLSAVAGICEEYVFRGFMLHGLAGWLGSAWVSAAVTAVAFGVGHGYQKAVGVVRASVLGFVLAVPVVVTGSLYPAVVGHFWINAAIGLGGWRWLSLPEPPPPVGTEGGEGP